MSSLLAKRSARAMHSTMRMSYRALSDFKRVGIVGIGGLMGHGVAQVTAAAGYQVLGIESQQSALDAGVKRIDDSLSKVIKRNVSKGVYDEEAGAAAKADIMSRIETSLNLEDVNSCDLIIEAIPENLDLKLQFYTNLGKIVTNPDCVFASNTSSLQITAMAEASGRPDKFVGLHFFNPVQLMKLVEVIKTEHTNKDTFDKMTGFGTKIGKTTVSCNDTPGFIVNRLLVPYLGQALSMVDRGDCSIEDIDVSMQLGAGHPMGPIHLADYIGLDTIHSILIGWQEDFPNEAAFFMPKCLDDKVKQGHFGRKSGQGFYHWDGEKRGNTV
jgi:3-hydroxyacyl-CoA dehydrogenase